MKRTPCASSLARLDQAAISALIAARYPMADDDRDRLTAYVARVSEGNPLLRRGSAACAWRRQARSSATVSAGSVAGLERVQVPTFVRQVIEGRLERLGR